MLIIALQSVEPATVDWIRPLIALVAFIVGGGTVGRWLAKKVQAGHEAETTKVLQKTFASQADLNNFRAAIELEMERLQQSMEFDMKDCKHTAQGAATLAEMASVAADKALANSDRVEMQQNNFQQRLIDEVLNPLHAMSKEQIAQGKTLAAQTALLERLTNQVDRKL